MKINKMNQRNNLILYKIYVYLRSIYIPLNYNIIISRYNNNIFMLRITYMLLLKMSR